MGYLTEKYTRIIKAPYYLYFKEAIEIRKVVRNLRELYTIIYITLPQKVEIDHKIRGSLKLQEKVVQIAKDSIKKDENMAINITIQEEKSLDIIKRIEDVWGKIRKDVGRVKGIRIKRELKNIDAQFTMLIRKSMQEAEKEDKGAYKDVMNIIKAAEKTDETFMAEMKTYFRKMNPSRLGRWAAKMEAKGVRNYIVALRKDEQSIKKLIKELDEDLEVIEGNKKAKKKGEALEKETDFHNVVKKLGILLKDMEGHIAHEFLNAYKVLKRDLTLIFVLLNQLDDLEHHIKQWVGEKKEPVSPEQTILRRIQTIEKDIGKHARTMAQGFRRVYHKEKALEKF